MKDSQSEYTVYQEAILYKIDYFLIFGAYLHCYPCILLLFHGLYYYINLISQDWRYFMQIIRHHLCPIMETQ
ncbi:hypothetical protein GLOIN_2v1721172 [Rhizophagus irregularis DAOM 181602=DAOM 197198]|uniref:Uncharacterized protein n=1 Tax=Rhizophagus irregularis (strain DAOM 181602 / DAOM 197198 / MUCL 43194) TaxID=747089 RepID=A0A2P4P2H7_RHIID|nr:hypothetical protein GLOIN_2v1721172 [Rhizophagus irregularis DAOM 181602=DAOM 197198]POG59564.1 hypothetical protein GLOIN_2v1721172 [Rhizophagus irregularis DAOM 181602=DAOM 197198]GET50641.1 hypothetical protein GLOIN_2v1721172 [Rhizophagus irregularis DAOM 181602=DAOM 197198]|eukprot:XP_025166430.1 hypothetical protein GLOIN_2v1721172 [Rhizophagus irregularis DAOM 181602=DAOM 197198]